MTVATQRYKNGVAKATLAELHRAWLARPRIKRVSGTKPTPPSIKRTPIKPVLSEEERRSRHNAKAREYYRKHPEVGRASSKKWSDNNKLWVRECRRARQQTELGRLQAKLNYMKRRLLGKNAPVATLDELIKTKALQGGRCFYCHSKTKLTLDHVVPVSRGGSFTIENIVWACVSCNARKGARLWRLC